MEPEPQADEEKRPRLFSPGFRACDTILVALIFGGPALVYYRIINGEEFFVWLHATILLVSLVSILGLLRVRIAFALLALPFFVWAAWSLVLAFFFPPEWSDLVNPIYVGKWAASIVIEYMIGAYFWKKFSKTDFIEWLSYVYERVKG